MIKIIRQNMDVDQMRNIQRSFAHEKTYLNSLGG